MMNQWTGLSHLQEGTFQGHRDVTSTKPMGFFGPGISTSHWDHEKTGVGVFFVGTDGMGRDFFHCRNNPQRRCPRDVVDGRPPIISDSWLRGNLAMIQISMGHGVDSKLKEITRRCHEQNRSWCLECNMKSSDIEDVADWDDVRHPCQGKYPKMMLSNGKLEVPLEINARFPALEFLQTKPLTRY